MSEKTAKLLGWTAQGRPAEDEAMNAHRRMIVGIVLQKFREKKDLLAKKGMPPQPISLMEIWKGYQNNVESLKAIEEWPYNWHGKRWLDRRVNECACAKYCDNGVSKLVAVKAGFYFPNKQAYPDIYK